MSTTTPTPSTSTPTLATQPDTDSLTPELTAAAPTCCGRRAMLRAAGLVALTGGAVALAACSADSSTGTPSADGTSAQSSAAEPSAADSPSESAAASPSAAESSDAPKGTAVPISEVVVGGGVIVQQKYVVTQPKADEFKAFSAICTHQGCPVGSVEDGQIVCPCHMSHFDITSGDPVSGPAQEPLPTVPFTRSGDNIVITA